MKGLPLRSYLQLFRIPNVFTAIADVTMGMVFVRQGSRPGGEWIALAVASTLLYLSGMVLNDVYDFDEDARERPHRPLPSGRIPLDRARRLGFGMLAAGVATGWMVGCLAAPPIWLAWRTGLVATSLAMCIWLYDAMSKRSLAGPWLMGACRTLNVLLGMSIGSAATPPAGLLHFEPEQWMTAGAIGLYVAGVTWFSRGEAATSKRSALAFGMALMIGGLAILAAFPRFASPGVRYHMDPLLVWPFAVLLLMVSTVRRCLLAVVHPGPRQVQAAVRQCLFSLIVLDAGVCLLMAPWPWAVGVLALLAPTLLLGRWIYST